MRMSKLKIGRKNRIDHLKWLNGNQPLRILTLKVPTPQNGQTHSNKSLAVAERLGYFRRLVVLKLS